MSFKIVLVFVGQLDIPIMFTFLLKDPTLCCGRNRKSTKGGNKYIAAVVEILWEKNSLLPTESIGKRQLNMRV